MSFKSNVLFSVICLAALATPVTAVVAQGTAAIPGIKPAAVATELSEAELMKKASLILFYNQVAQMKLQLDRDGIALDSKSALEGVRRALEGEEVGVPIDDIKAVMTQMQKKVMAIRASQQKEMEAQREEMMAKMQELAAKNKTAGEAYLAENGKKEGVKTLANGVQYEVMVAGTGAKPKPTDKIKINYHGTAIDGKVFDSTIKPPGGRPAEPYVSSASGFVKGFNAAVQEMPVGSKWKVTIPSDLAYGLRGGGPIEPNQTIIFEVELLEILAEGEAAPGQGQ